MKLMQVHYHSEQREKVSVFQLELHPGLIALLDEMGIISVREDSLEAEELLRLRKVLRLKSSCGVNLNGAAIIVELLERIERLQDEIERLRKGQVT